MVVGDNWKELYLCDHIPGDVDGNGFVNLLDVGPFVESITDRYVCEADINQDGTVDLLDVEPFVQILTDN